MASVRRLGTHGSTCARPQTGWLALTVIGVMSGVSQGLGLGQNRLIDAASSTFQKSLGRRLKPICSASIAETLWHTSNRMI